MRWTICLVTQLVAVTGLAQPLFAQSVSTEDGKGFSESTPQVSIEVRFLTLAPDFVPGFTPKTLPRSVTKTNELTLSAASDEPILSDDGIRMISATHAVEKHRPLFVETVAADELPVLIRKAQQDPRTNLLFAPKVTVFDGQFAEINDTTQRRFVTGLVKNEEEGGRLKAGIRTLEEGTRIGLRTRLQPDRSVRLDVRLRRTNVLGVGVATAGPNGERVQTPDLELSDVELSALLKPGSTLAVWGLKHHMDGRTVKGTSFLWKKIKKAPVGQADWPLLVLLTPRAIDPEPVVDAPLGN